MKKTIVCAVISAVFGGVSAFGAVDCSKASLAVKSAVTADQEKVLEIVSKEVSTAPDCACEVVKAAIEASSANPDKVALIVETAVTAAPEQMRIISQCAVAVAPDALAKVQAVIAKLDPNGGKTGKSAKGVIDAKDAKSPGEVAAMPNPLDFPGQGPVGPIPGGPGGFPLIPIYPPIIIPNPPEVTSVNPAVVARR